MTCVIYYDGYCNFCSFIVSKIYKYDRSGAFTYRNFDDLDRDKLFLPDDYKHGQTLVLKCGDDLYFASDAVFRIVKMLRSPWKYLHYFSYLPRKLRDFLYYVIAKNRYQLFGTRSDCYVPEDKKKR